MMKFLKIIRNVIFGIIFVLYLLIVISASTLVLNRNDFGYTQFGDKSLIDISEDTASYLKGQLVIVGEVEIANLSIGDEVFIYRTNVEEQTIKIISSTIKEINVEDSRNSYITIDLDDTSWGQEYIAGQALKVYDKLGGVLSFVESKWIFFVIFIVPCFFILLYEIYSVIIVIKFEGGEAAIEMAGDTSSEGSSDDLSALMDEINNLKSQLNNAGQDTTQQNTTTMTIPVEQTSVVQSVSTEQAVPVIQTPVTQNVNTEQVVPTSVEQDVQVSEPIFQPVVEDQQDSSLPTAVEIENNQNSNVYPDFPIEETKVDSSNNNIQGTKVEDEII